MRKKLRSVLGGASQKGGMPAICEAVESRLMLTVTAATVTTGAVTPVSSTSVTLNATVNPNGSTTSAYFQYSSSPSFPVTTQQTIGSGFSGPFGLALDAAGDVFVGDTGNHYVKEIHVDGSITTVGSGFSNPQGIAVNAAGDVFVVDYHSSVVQEVLPNGTINDIGSGFSFPEGVALDSAGDIFVADMGTHSVKEILPNGTINTIGSGFNSPYDVAVNAAGDVFVADRYGNDVKEVLPNGTINTVGSGFNNPFGVSVDAAGDVFVADGGNNAVKEVLPNGTINTLGSGFSYPYRVAVDPAGDVFVNANQQTAVVKLSPTATAPSSLTGNTATAASATVTGLTHGVTYYGRVIAASAGGTIVGQTVAFTTKTPVSISPTPVDLTYGTALANSQITGVATVNSVSVPGTFSFATDAGTVLAAGAHSGEAVTFTPTDTSTYALAGGTVTVNVAAATPTLGTFGAIQINYGTALNNSELVNQASWVVNGQSLGVPGTFSFTSAAGTVLEVGSGQAESVTFTPTDTTDYNPVTTSVNVTVNVDAAVAHVSDAGGVFDGSPFAAGGTVTYNNTIIANPTIQYFSLDGSSQPTLLNGAPSAVGKYEAIATYDDAHDHAPATTVPFMITPAVASITLSNLSQIADLTAKSVAVITAPAGIATKITYSQNGNTVIAPTAPGTYDVLVSVTDPNYAGSTTGTLTISPFTRLASPLIVVRRPSLRLTGTVAPKVLVKGALVTITLNGVQETAKVGRLGRFLKKFNTSNLAPGTYTVQYAYQGPGNSQPTTWTQTLSVISKVSANINIKNQFPAGTTIPVKIRLINFPRHTTPGTPATVTALGIISKSSPDTVLPLPAATTNDGIFISQGHTGKYDLALGTTGLLPGKYLLVLSIAGDPIIHSIGFAIR